MYLVVTFGLLCLAGTGHGAEDTDDSRMAPKPGSFDGAVWLASGITCAAIFLDLAGRYYYWRRGRRRLVTVDSKQTQTVYEKNAECEGTEVDIQMAASLALDFTIGDGEVIIDQELLPSESTGYTMRRQPSRTSSRRSSISRTDGMSRSESFTQAIQALQTGGMAHAQATDSGRGVQDVLNDLVEAMRTNIQLAASVNMENYPRGFKQRVEKIRSVKNDLDMLSDDITTCALGLVDQDDVTDDRPEADIASDNGSGNDALSSALKRRAFLRSQWLSLRRLLFCVDLQLRHAAIYHVFSEESKELKRLLLDVYEQIKGDGQPEDSTAGVSTEEFKRMSAYLLLLQTNVQDLAARSPFVIPLRMRKDPISEPVQARCICSLTSDRMEVHDGDSITILDNSNAHSWTVRHVSGVEAQIPAVCCVIPPPDKGALLSAARLQKAMVAVMTIYMLYVEPWLVEHCKKVLQDILKKKNPLLTRLTTFRRQETQDSLRHLANATQDLFSHLPTYQDLKDTEEELESVIQKSATTTIEAPRTLKELTEPIQELNNLLGILQGLHDKKQEAQTVSLNHGLEQYLDEDTLDWVTPILEGADSANGLAVSVHSQKTEVAETSSVTSSSGEVRQTFSIRAVIDPRDNVELSIAEAIERGILDPDRGLYIHPEQKDLPIPIPVAMNAGLIIVESTETKKTKEKIKAVGLVTVNVTQETRPYTITRVRDPISEEEIPVSDAIGRGLFDPQSGVWINPGSDERINVKDAIDAGLLIVDYDANAEVSAPDVTTRTFAVYGVTDRKEGKRLAFHEACERGIISKEDGEFLDTKSNTRHSVIEAARKGWVKVRVVEEGTRLDDIINRNRSDSIDSLQSTGSSTN